MATTAKQQADWSLKPRGPISGTVQGALAVAALAVVGDVAALEPIWGGIATAGAGVGSVLVSAHRNHAPPALLYRLVCWLGAGSWLTYTLAAGLWTQSSWAALGVGALVAGVVAPLAQATKRPARHGRTVILRSGARVGAAWEARIQRVCRIPVTVTNVVRWESGAGYDVHVELPGSGSTRKQLATAADALATDAKLPEGCGVEVVPGEHRGAAILRVSTVNRLHEDIDYPADYRPRSILEPFALGEHRDSSPAEVMLREASALVTGKKGSGKTTTLHALTAGVGLCRDALVWHIDLNGGGMSQPWLHPWLEGDVDRPAVDWAAASPEEAVTMAEVAVAIAKDRKRSTRKLKIQANSSLMPVSKSLPEIVIILDEGAEAMSPANRDPVLRDLREALEEIQRIGRNEGVNVVISSLRATGDMISPNVKKQSDVRIGMYVTDEEELAFLFGWNRGIGLADLPGVGCGFIQTGQGTPRPFRSYYMRPGDVVDASQAVSRMRPELDQAAREIAGEVYATRYARMRAAFADLDDDQADKLPAMRAPVPAPATRPNLQVVHGDAAAWPDLRELTRKPVPVVSGSAADWPDLRPRRAALTAEQVREDEARPLPEILRRVLAAFADADDDRMHSQDLADALDTTPTELAALLRPFNVGTLPHKFSRGGQERRGYARADVQRAADRFARGELADPTTAGA